MSEATKLTRQCARRGKNNWGNCSAKSDAECLENWRREGYSDDMADRIFRVVDEAGNVVSAPSYSVPREPVGTVERLEVGQRWTFHTGETEWTITGIDEAREWPVRAKLTRKSAGGGNPLGYESWGFRLDSFVTEQKYWKCTPSTTLAVPAAKEAAKAYEGPHLCGLLCYATGCPFGRIAGPSQQGRALADELKALQAQMAANQAAAAQPRIAVPASPPKPQKRELREVSHNGRDWVSYDSLTDGDAFEAYHYRRVNGVLDRSALLAFAEARWPRIVGNYQECYDVGKTIHSYDKYGGASLSSFERLKPWRPSVDDVDLLPDAP